MDITRPCRRDHLAHVLRRRYSSDLASGSDDRTTIVWDVDTGSLLHTLGPYLSCHNVLTFSEDSAWITPRTDEKCFVWELQSGELLERRERGVFVETAYMTPYHLSVTLGGNWSRKGRPRRNVYYSSRRRSMGPSYCHAILSWETEPHCFVFGHLAGDASVYGPRYRVVFGFGVRLD